MEKESVGETMVQGLQSYSSERSKHIKQEPDDDEDNTSSKPRLRCCIRSCRNTEPPLFIFPSDPKTRRLWERAVDKKKQVKSRGTRICMKHFAPEDLVRDLQSELLGLTPKPKIRDGVVPRFNLVASTPSKSDQTSEMKAIRYTQRGRLIKINFKKEISITGETKASIPVLSSPVDLSKEMHNYSATVPKGISEMANHIKGLKDELAQLRRSRKAACGLPKSPGRPRKTSLGNSSGNTDLSAEDIRQRYRSEVGLRTIGRTPNGVMRVLKGKNADIGTPSQALSEDDKNNLFLVSLSSLALQGSPEITAEYFVNQIIDAPLKLIDNKTKNDLEEYLGQNMEDGVILFDQEAHHLWQIYHDATKEALEPLERMAQSGSTDPLCTTTRPRERFFAERKIRQLEPELQKWKDEYESLRNYRKTEMNKLANSRAAKMKRNARRKQRREWLTQQIKEGKLHKSALIWVNSTKVLPFERGSGASTEFDTAMMNDDGDEDVILSDDDCHDSSEELGEVSSVKHRKEPKDLKKRAKKSSHPTHEC